MVRNWVVISLSYVYFFLFLNLFEEAFLFFFGCGGRGRAYSYKFLHKKYIRWLNKNEESNWLEMKPWLEIVELVSPLAIGQWFMVMKHGHFKASVTSWTWIRHRHLYNTYLTHFKHFEDFVRFLESKNLGWSRVQF